MKQHTIPELEALLPADDETVAHMAEKYPVLSDAEKERIYQMSERKYRMKAGDLTMHEIPVTPEEELECQPMEVQTKRSYRVLLETAACLLLVVGVIGGVVFPLRRQLQQGGTESVLPIVTDITTDSRMQTSATTAPIQTTTETVTTTSEPLMGAALEAQMKNTVIPELLEVMKKMDWLTTSGAIYSTFDYNTKYVENNREYFRYGECSTYPYQHISDIKNDMEAHMTDSLIAKRYSNLITGTAPRFLEHGNQLYVAVDSAPTLYFGCEAQDFTFKLQKKNEATVGDADFCSVEFTDAYNTDITCQVDLVLTDGIWKLDNVVVDPHVTLCGPITGTDPQKILDELLERDLRMTVTEYLSTCMLDPSTLRTTLEEYDWTDNDGVVQHDANYTTWYLVKDPNYSTMEELRRYIRTFRTEQYFQHTIKGDDIGHFREFDGMLFASTEDGKGWENGWSETPAKILEMTETSFTAKKFQSCGIEDFGETTITCVKEADGWKIDKMEKPEIE